MISKIHNDGYVELGRIFDGYVPKEHIMTKNYVETIGANCFPEQDEKVGTDIRVIYKMQKSVFRDSSVFHIVRMDKENPNVVILKHKKKEIYLVADPKTIEDNGKGEVDWDGYPVPNKYVHSYPGQFEELLGESCRLEFFDSEEPAEGVILRLDKSNSMTTGVIFDKTNQRYLLPDEVRILIKEESINK